MAVAVIVAGCSSSSPVGDPSGEVVGGDRGSASERPEMTAPFQGMAFQYISEASPADLAAASDITVRGNVASFSEGRVEAVTNGDLVQEPTTIMALDGVEVVDGDAGSSFSGQIYIELPRISPRAAQQLDIAFPAGTEVVAYLTRGWDGLPNATTGTEMVDPAAGRPVGQPLYVFVSPQGFIAQLPENDTIVWPLGDDQEVGDIVETLPEGDVIGNP